MVGRAALAGGPPHGRACCARAWPPSWWGVLCWCLPAAVVVRGLVVFGLGCRRLLDGLGLLLCCLLGRGWCCAGACPPLCWGAPCLCLPPPLVGCAVSACSGFGSWCCGRLDAPLVLLVLCCLRRHMAGFVGCWLSVVFAPPGLVLCWCVRAAPLLGRAVFVRAPPHGGACCLGV